METTVAESQVYLQISTITEQVTPPDTSIHCSRQEPDLDAELQFIEEWLRTPNISNDTDQFCRNDSRPEGIDHNHQEPLDEEYISSTRHKEQEEVARHYLILHMPSRQDNTSHWSTERSLSATNKGIPYSPFEARNWQVTINCHVVGHVFVVGEALYLRDFVWISPRVDWKCYDESSTDIHSYGVFSVLLNPFKRHCINTPMKIPDPPYSLNTPIGRWDGRNKCSIMTPRQHLVTNPPSLLLYLFILAETPAISLRRSVEEATDPLYLTTLCLYALVIMGKLTAAGRPAVPADITDPRVGLNHG